MYIYYFVFLSISVSKRTPSHDVVRNGKTEFATLLINSGANTNVVDMLVTCKFT